MNNDINNPCVDDYGTFENMDNGNVDGGGGGGGSSTTYGQIVVSTSSLSVEVVNPQLSLLSWISNLQLHNQ